MGLIRGSREFRRSIIRKGLWYAKTAVGSEMWADDGV